jgi:hypothetical protein
MAVYQLDGIALISNSNTIVQFDGIAFYDTTSNQVNADLVEVAVASGNQASTQDVQVSLAESPTISETTTAANTIDVGAADSSAAEAVSTCSGILSSERSEALSMADESLAIMMSACEITSPSSASDSQFSTASFVSACAEPLSSGDTSLSNNTINMMASEAGAANEALSVFGIFASIALEVLSAADDQVALLNLVATLADTASAAETWGSEVTGSLVIANETASALDGAVVLMSAVASRTDQVFSSDNLTASFHTLATLSESLPASETQSSGILTIATIAQVLTAIDDQSAGALYDRMAQESAGANGIAGALSGRLAALFESLSSDDNQASGACRYGSATEAAASSDSIVASQWLSAFVIAASNAGEVSISQVIAILLLFGRLGIKNLDPVRNMANLEPERGLFNDDPLRSLVNPDPMRGLLNAD